MPQIRPISDLRNRFTEISRIVHEDKEPVFLTKNGYGDMVVMSIEDYEARKFERDVDVKLQEACSEALNTNERLAHGEVMGHLREIIKNAASKI
jgi:prevent-host-death family protein